MWLAVVAGQLQIEPGRVATLEADEHRLRGNSLNNGHLDGLRVLNAVADDVEDRVLVQRLDEPGRRQLAVRACPHTLV